MLGTEDRAVNDGGGRRPIRRARPSGRALWMAAAALSAAAIASLTLGPGELPPSEPYPMNPFCLVCGDRGGADAILNVLLFLPLGLAVTRVWGWLPALGLAVAFSGTVEVLQASTPGRFPTIGDIVWNTGGAVLGAVVAHLQARLPSLAPRARLGLAATVLLLPLLPATVLGPAETDAEYFAQWAPRVSSGRSYPGRVTSVTLDGVSLPVGVLDRADAARAALRRGAPLRVSFVAARPLPERAQIFRIVDAHGDEIAAIAARGLDLSWTERTVASRFLLLSPAVVWRRALEGVAPGSAVTLVVRKEGGSVCIERDARSRCGLRATLADGWETLEEDPGIPVLNALLRVLWLAVPAFVAGLLAAPVPVGVLLVSMFGVAAAALAGALPGAAVAVTDLALVVAGVVVGSLASRAADPRRIR